MGLAAVENDEARRARVLRELLASLAHARAHRAEWYVWATEGQPVLTEAEYRRVGRPRRATRE